MRARSLVPILAGAAAGAGAALLLRAWLRFRTRLGARRSLRLGISGIEDVGNALFQATGVSMMGGNRVIWRHDTEVFTAIERAIEEAKHSIHVDLYIWKPGRLGGRIAELVQRRAREGVAVRVLVDPMGSDRFGDELFRPLVEAGCDVRYFRAPKRVPFSITGRNHRKLVVVDGCTGFTGGFGFGDEWLGGEGAVAWRDANVEAHGPVVRQMQAAFAAHWLETGGALLPAEEFRRCEAAGDARAAYVTSMDVEGLSHARWVTHIALMAARRRAFVANAYFVPPPEVLGALLVLPRRKIDLRLLFPGPHGDHKSVTFVQRRYYPLLSRSGARVFEYQPSMMHAKTMLIDDRLVVVGSINLDFLSMEWLEEGSLVVDDAPFAAALEEQWRDDVARSRERTTERPTARVVRGPEAQLEL